MASARDQYADGRGDDSGYIADMLYHVPANPPITDLPVFIRDVPLKLD